MNRLARVVAINHHCVTLDLLQTPQCEGCPSNCNKPLFKLFALKGNLFNLSTSESGYELIGFEQLLRHRAALGQVIRIKVQDHDLLKSSLVLYLLPLLICLFCMTVGHGLGVWSKVSTDLASGLGLLVGFIITYWLFAQQKINKYLKFSPKVTIL